MAKAKGITLGNLRKQAKGHGTSEDAADAKADKKAGIKEGSAKDKKLDLMADKMKGI